MGVAHLKDETGKALTTSLLPSDNVVSIARGGRWSDTITGPPLPSRWSHRRRRAATAHLHAAPVEPRG